MSQVQSYALRVLHAAPLAAMILAALVYARFSDRPTLGARLTRFYGAPASPVALLLRTLLRAEGASVALTLAALALAGGLLGDRQAGPLLVAGALLAAPLLLLLRATGAADREGFRDRGGGDAERAKSKHAGGGAEEAESKQTTKSKHADADGEVLVHPETLERALRADFAPTTYRNPFGNVLLTDIADDPARRPAAPSFHPRVDADIRAAVQRQTQKLNPGLADTDRQLYGDLKAQFDLDASLQRFYAMPSTRVGGDQGAFGQFLFGGMHSAKEDTPEGALMRVKDNERYLLI